jgi:enamine deaminase RidA (YjgF/YER057c/UK114 family)
MAQSNPSSRRAMVSTGTEWERVAGYSRGIRVGPRVEVAGTTAMQDGLVVGGDDPYAQARHALTIVEDTLVQLGSALTEVVRTRMYVVDIRHWPAVVRAHGEVFGAIRPVATLVQVAALIDPRLLVEIEAEAWSPEA